MAKKAAAKKSNSGRKPIPDKKIQLSVYINRSKIDKLGGEDATKQKIVDFVDQEALKNNS